MSESEKIRDSFIFYRSFYQSAKKLSKEDKAEIFDAICCYALDGQLMELSIVPEAIFTVIKPNLDANRRKWNNGCKEKKKKSKPEANQKQTRSKPEAKDKQKISKPEANVNVNVDVNDNVECKSESQFESLWCSYTPIKTSDGFVKKGSKKKAKQAFMKAIEKTAFEKIMIALESYLRYCQQNNRFTKNVSSWLSEEDFEEVDEFDLIPSSLSQPKTKDDLRQENNKASSIEFLKRHA